MRLQALVIITAILFCSACAENQSKTEVKAHGKTQIIELMQAQETAWNLGDLKGYMSAYWNNDSLLFIGSRGLNYGWETTLSNYQKSYPTKDKMGTLAFENKQLKPLSNDAYWCAGRWSLYRITDTLQGSYLLVWKNIDGAWKIVADHSS